MARNLLSEARSKQSYPQCGLYTGGDTFSTQKIEPQKIYALIHGGQVAQLKNGEPIHSEFFFDEATFSKYENPDTHGFDSTALSRAVQVAPYHDEQMSDYDHYAEYRTSVVCFDLNEEIDAPVGICMENTQFGEGGGHQLFIPEDMVIDMQNDGRLAFNEEESAINKGENIYLNKDEYFHINDDAKTRADDCEYNNTEHPSPDKCNDGFEKAEPIEGDVFGIPQEQLKEETATQEENSETNPSEEETDNRINENGEKVTLADEAYVEPKDENLNKEDVPEKSDISDAKTEEHPDKELSEESAKEKLETKSGTVEEKGTIAVKGSGDAVEEPKEDAEEALTNPEDVQKDQQNVEPEPSEDINKSAGDVPKEDVPHTGEAENPEKQKEVEKTPEGNKEDLPVEDKEKEVPDKSTEHTDEKTVSPEGAKPEPQKKPEEVSTDPVDEPKEEPKIESSEDHAIDKPREEKNDESKGVLEDNTPTHESPHEDPNEVKTKPGEQAPAGGQTSMEQLVPDGQQETPKNTMAGLADGQEPKAEPNKTMNGLAGDEEQQNTNGANNTMNGLTGEDSQTNQSSGNNSSSTETKEEEDDDYKYTY